MPLLAIRFLVELAGVAALGFVGAAAAPDGVVVRLLLAAGLPVALIAVWAMLVAPKAGNPLSQPARQLIGTMLLVGVGVALALVGEPGWGTSLIVVTVADQALLLLLSMDAPAATLDGSASAGGR